MIRAGLAGVIGLVTLAAVVYYVAWALIHLGVVLIGAVQFRRLTRRAVPPANGPGLTVAVAAYDERPTVASTVESLVRSSYPLSIVLVDDGSTDGTFEVVAEAYDLQAVSLDADLPPEVTAYEAADVPLTVLRQPNRGKSAALNCALALTETPLFAVVDADTVVEPDAIGKLVAPFEDEATVAAGGSFRVTQAPSPSGGDLTRRLSPAWIERFQALDHLRVFVLRQLGRSCANVMFTVFGACSVFRTEQVRAVEGFSDVETEDFELAVALRRHCIESGRDCRFVHVPSAVAWTTVPSDLAGLTEQRGRWVRGITETLAIHRSVVGNPAYGRFGTVAVPYAMFGELLWLLVEAVGYVLVPAGWLAGVVSTPVVLAFLFGTFVLGPLASVVSVVATGGHGSGYDTTDRRSLLATAVAERLGYRPVLAVFSVFSVYEYFR